MNPDDLQSLVTFVMPYGKYKDRLIADLPGNYLNWFARKGFPSGELGRLLALMQEMDHNGLSSLLDIHYEADIAAWAINGFAAVAGCA